MKNYNVGYYPINEIEMKEIIKLLKLYSKKDNEALDEIFNKYNCSIDKKEEIKKALKECVVNREEKIFEKRFGKCIVEVQKLYRESFNIEGLSLTGFVEQDNSLKEYIRPMEDIFSFAGDKHDFAGSLKYENASGLYITYNKVKKLYVDYSNSEIIKQYVENYFGKNTEKFLEILKYCINQKVGILEASVGKIENNKLENKEEIIEKNNKIDKKEEIVKDVNVEEKKKKVEDIKENAEDIKEEGKKENIKIEEKNVKNNKEKNIVDNKNWWKFSFQCILVYIGIALVYEFIYDFIELFVKSDANYSILKSLIVIFSQIAINFGIWTIVTKIVLKNVKIKKETLKKIFAVIAIFFVVYIGIITSIRELGLSNSKRKNMENITAENISTELEMSRVESIKENYDKNNMKYDASLIEKINRCNSYKEYKMEYEESLTKHYNLYLFCITLSIIIMTVVMFGYTIMKYKNIIC